MLKNCFRANSEQLSPLSNKEPFHLRHALTVEGIMRYFAKELGYADEVEYWGIVGLLHDLDFEQYPEEHCVKSQELMRQHGVDESIIRALDIRNRFFRKNTDKGHFQSGSKARRNYQHRRTASGAGIDKPPFKCP